MKFITHKEDKEAIIRLWLEEKEDKVRLMGRDNEGENCLMVFRDGKFYKLKGVELEGFEVDEKGRIKEEL